MKLVFTGIQGCGKGTQARFLVENHGYKLIEMGGALREIAASGSDFGNSLKATLESGALVTPDIVGGVMKEILEKQTNENIILDGFIRNEGNKKSLEEVIGNNYTVVFFQLSKEKAIDRLLGRMYNPKTQETFPSHVLTDPKTGDQLEKRKDDNEESILKRIDEFMTKTLPTTLGMQKTGKVIEINADQSIDAVAKEIELKLGL